MQGFRSSLPYEFVYQSYISERSTGHNSIISTARSIRIKLTRCEPTIKCKRVETYLTITCFTNLCEDNLMGKRERLKSRRERAKRQLCTYITLFFIHVQLFRERSNKVHATIPKDIAGDFEFTVLQKNLKEWHERPWTHVCEC